MCFLLKSGAKTSFFAHFPHLSLQYFKKSSIFAVENGENGLYLGIEQALCTRFAPSLQTKASHYG